MTPKAKQTVAMKTAMKAVKGKEAKAMKAKKMSKVELARKKRAREAVRVRKSRAGTYSRVAKREELRVAKEELRVAEAEIERLNREAEAKTWRRMGGGDGVVDFRREVGEEGEEIGGWISVGYQAGYGAAEAIDGGAKWGMYDRKEVWVEGFQDGWDEFLAEKRRKEEEEEKGKRKVKEEKTDGC